MAKKKKGRPKKVDVGSSNPHRRRGGWVSGYWRNRTKKAHRNKKHKRNRRRSKEEIKQKGTRKEERTRRRQEKRQKRRSRKKVQKTKQTTFGAPRQRPAQRSIKKTP